MNAEKLARNARLLRFYDRNKGRGLRVTAREFGLAYSTTRKIVARAGALPRTPWGYVPMRLRRRVLSRWERGQSQTEIARAVGKTQLWVSRVLRLLGRTPTRRNVGPRHGAWKGGRWSDGNGYVHVWLTPADPMRAMAMRDGYVLEHRLVVARRLGRPLESHETVHHLDGDRTHNKSRNLQLRSGRHGRGCAYICARCGSRDIIAAKLK